MRIRVLIPGDHGRFGRYVRAVSAAGGSAVDREAESDALLLTGGGDIEPWRYGQKNSGSRDFEPGRDTEELALLERFIAAEKPVLGICRGMQVINVYFGGTLMQDIDGHAAEDGRDRLHAVYTSDAMLMHCCGERCVVNSAHHQALDRLGNGVWAVQWAEDGVVEAIRHSRFSVWGVQWHPERLKGAEGARLFRCFLDERSSGL